MHPFLEDMTIPEGEILKAELKETTRNKKNKEKSIFVTQNDFPGAKHMTVDQSPKCNTGNQKNLKNKNSRETTKREGGQLKRQELE